MVAFSISRRTVIYIVCGVVIGAALVSLVILPAVLPGALGAVGFTASGPLLGSSAAAIQSSIGLVSAGSTFALAQSVAMGGMIPIAWTLGAAAVGGLIGGISGGAAARLTPLIAPRIASVMRGAQTVASRAVRGARRLTSWVRQLF